MRIRRRESEAAMRVLDALKKNGGYCPCKVEKLPENKCLCREFLNQEESVCHCGLYEKLEN